MYLANISVLICFLSLIIQASPVYTQGSTSRHVRSTSKVDTDYWAALYTKRLSFPKLETMPEYSQPDITTYTYFIQYGENMVIELRDPGVELDALPTMIIKWDYANRTFTVTTILNNADRYFTSQDTIPLSIDDSKYDVHLLCDIATRSSDCDSIFVTSKSSDARYLVLLSDLNINVAHDRLFYPDVVKLPRKISRLDGRRSPMILKEVIYGKEAVETLLSLYTYEGYERISDQELNSYELQISPETLKELEELHKSKE